MIDDKILEGRQVLKQSDLRNKYVGYLGDSDFPNQNYRGNKFKSKLQNDSRYTNTIYFCELLGNCPKSSGYLVYSKDVSIDDAIAQTYTPLEATHRKPQIFCTTSFSKSTRKRMT